MMIRKKLGAGVPILFSTNGEGLEIELEARLKGVNYFVRKPILLKEMNDIMQEVYEQSFEETNDSDESGFPDCTGKRILVAEDNDINAEIITEILSMSGATIDRAANGMIAFEMMARVKECLPEFNANNCKNAKALIVTAFETKRAVFHVYEKRPRFCDLCPVILGRYTGYEEKYEKRQSVYQSLFWQR